MTLPNLPNFKVIVLFSHLGPYHYARLKAASQSQDISAVEYSNIDCIYNWQPMPVKFSFPQITLFKDQAYQDQPRHTQQIVLETCLENNHPKAVTICGWSNSIALMALTWCSKNRVPAILMADSTEQDEVRRCWKEIPKRRILRNISTALVGGQLQRDYLIKLGIPPDRIFLGYDVVDNDHFANGAAQARQLTSVLRQQLGLPEHFFLASARFIPKKNLDRLLQAYAQYRTQAGIHAWSLVLLGDGPLKTQLCRQIEQLNLTPWVHLPGFKQYNDLPAYYGLAHCFIHASTTEQWGLVVNEAMAAGLPVLVSDRCGCTPDLVQNGCNGYVFNPYSPDYMAELMLKISSGNCDLIAMGKASQAIIAQWTPQTFADSLQKAVEMAVTLPQKKLSFFDHALLFALSRRSFLH